ncbi:EscU/YscU/HrcU family type III secretion system export apparatus switch protein [Azospirillum sp. SYSU D00513]|uniref:EscU/YscU/HrcU family type III secretion system export apparatus switch protein n=1 Tax=Azospirillum sp. SYSU D00513 TaxID=2812561 RepID=UPI001A96BE27
MSGEAASKDQKQFQATPQRLEQARRKGDVAHSRDATQALMLMCVLAWLSLVLPGAASAFLAWGLALMQNPPMRLLESANGLTHLGWEVGGRLMVILMPLLAMLIAAPAASGLAQQSIVLTMSKLAPDPSHISPASGFKRLFSAQALVEFAKGTIKMSVAFVIVGLVLKGEVEGIISSGELTPGAALSAFSAVILRCLASVVAMAMAVAIIDLLWQRYHWNAKLMMTREEVKQDMRQSEGDQETKTAIRHKQMEKSVQRMKEGVKKSSVLITNPTHFAVALLYDPEKVPLPVVMAKGVDAVALELRKTAREEGIPIIENRPLARLLHAQVELHEPIRKEHFGAVAEVIAYILGLEAEKN